MTPKKRAKASLRNIHRIFTVPEDPTSTLSIIEKKISKNLAGFLRDHIVAEDMGVHSLEQNFLDTKIAEDPLFVSEQADFLLENVVAQSVHVASPSFIGHMTSAVPYFMLPLAKIMIALNQNTVKIETSKAFTPLESQVIGMLHRLIYDFDESFYRRWTHDRDHALGVFCSGGTTANITSLWVARNLLLTSPDPQGGPDVYRDGLLAAVAAHGYRRLCIIASKRAHYSLKKAADLLGIGRNNLILVDTHNFKLSPAALEKEILRLKAERAGIVSIVGIAGTTETGHVDPLDEMAALAAEHRIHFHVDAAWGGPTLFSKKYRPLLRGIEQADSVVIDAHKQLYVPMGAATAVFKKETALAAIQTNANYIIRRGSRDLGKFTLEGSKPGMAMLVQSSLKIIGRKGYELLIDGGIEKARYFAQLIEQANQFELMSKPELNLLTYRFVPFTLKTKLRTGNPEFQRELNELLSHLTMNIQKIQREKGKTFVSRTSFECPQYNNQTLTVFRVVLANPLTTKTILREVLAEQQKVGQELCSQEPFASKFNNLLTSQSKNS